MTQRYAVIGVGGTGTYLIPGLARYLRTFHGGSDSEVWQLGLLDGDEIEEKNMDRQVFAADALLMNKAIAAAREYQHFGSCVIPIPEYLGKHNIEQYITDGTIVLIAADNFPVRALLEDHCAKLQNATIINGGNEKDSGSCQIYVRRGGVDLTPPISFLHPEIRQPGPDRSEMSCVQIAELPGGEQLITANMMSATWMLCALMMVNSHVADLNNETLRFWTELQFDLVPQPKYQVYGIDNRKINGWRNIATN